MLRRCRPLLGTFVEISAADEAAIDAAFAAVERVHCLMSAHQPDSDVSRINRFGHVDPVEIDGWTALVLERALFWAKESHGAFDVVRAGQAAMASGSLPRHSDQPSPQAGHWTWLEVQGRTVRLLKPGCVDLGGIAKGFAVDRAVDALRKAGATRGLVNAGGDLRAFGPKPCAVTVLDPTSGRAAVEVSLENGALATSAGLPTQYGGLAFGHLPGVDQRWASVSVRAPSCCDADALTKIVWDKRAAAAPLLASADADAFAITANGIVEAPWERERAAA